jgi:hypothetical protein
MQQIDTIVPKENEIQVQDDIYLFLTSYVFFLNPALWRPKWLLVVLLLSIREVVSLSPACAGRVKPKTLK